MNEHIKGLLYDEISDIQNMKIICTDDIKMREKALQIKISKC